MALAAATAEAAAAAATVTESTCAGKERFMANAAANAAGDTIS